MSFCCQQIRFQASCSFYLHFSALCRSTSTNTPKRRRFCIFDRKLIVFIVSFLFSYCFFAALSRPRCLSFIWQRRDPMKRRVLVRHNAAAGCHRRTRRGTFGSRAERHQLKVCDISELTNRSFLSRLDRSQTDRVSSPLIHARAGKQAAALCVKHGECD